MSRWRNFLYKWKSDFLGRANYTPKLTGRLLAIAEAAAEKYIWAMIPVDSVPFDDKRMPRIDISKTLNSQDDVKRHLVKTFPDAIVLKDYLIVAISDHTAQLFGRSAKSLIGKSFQTLAGAANLKRVREELNKGFFDRLVIPLKGKSRKKITCTISGFYMNPDDANGLVILKIQPFNQGSVPNTELEASQNELDEFVYRTTHDLRGPLATMQGLINLMRIEAESASANVKDLIGMLATQARTLDDRLFHLAYLSETVHPRKTDYTFDCAYLESILRSTLEQNRMIDSIEFSFATHQRFFSKINAQLAIAALNHLLLYLINLAQRSAARLSYNITEVNRGMQVAINAEGFASDYRLRQAIEQQDPLYTTVITYADLISFFAAIKNIKRIRGTIQVDSITELRQQITVWIPTN